MPETIETRLDCLEYDIRDMTFTDGLLLETVRQLSLARKAQVQNLKNLAALQIASNNVVARLEQQVQTLQGVVGSLQQDVATLEEKVAVMEGMLNVEVCTDDVDEGGAERADFAHYMEEEIGKSEMQY